MDKNLFYDFISLRPVQVPKDKKVKMIDSVLSSIEEQKKLKDIKEISGLHVRAQFTHAARLTGHYHFYSPAKVRDGVNTFTTPYNKPVLPHHNEQADPLGRIISASYLSTPHVSVSASIMDASELNKVHNERNLKWVKKLTPFLLDKRFEGLGYVEGMLNITDPDGIVKVIDQRYHTLSVGYGTDTLHCSHCMTEWVGEGPCDHYPGQMIDGLPVFLIYGNLWYDEISYINAPADELAQNQSFEYKNYDFNQHVKDSSIKARTTNEIRNARLMVLSKDSNNIQCTDRICAVEPHLYLLDKQTGEYKPQIFNGDTDMHSDIKELVSLSSADFYKKLELSDENKLSDEELEKLEDSDFIGPNRTFCAVDKAHIEACRALLESAEDSEDKTEILQFLKTKEDSLMVNQNSDDNKPEGNEENNDNTNNNAEENESIEVKVVLEKDGTVKVTPEDLASDRKIIIGDALTKDAVRYYFTISSEGGPWEAQSERDFEIEQELLGLLMRASEAKQDEAKDSNVDFIKKLIGEDNADNKVLSALTDAYGLKKDQSATIAELESQIKNQRDQYSLLTKTKDAVIADLTQELKDNLIDHIMLLGKEDPDPESRDAKLASFKAMGIDELKAAVKVVDTLTQSKDSGQIKDPSKNQDDEGSSLSVEQINTELCEIETRYQKIKSLNGQKHADAYYSHVIPKIKALKEQLKELESEEE
jgi:hypothetical protein